MEYNSIENEASKEASKPLTKIYNPNVMIDQEKVKSQFTTNIETVEVIFPYQPYRIQSDYMKCVIKACEKRQNALLESPTGTGKTLSLI